MKNTMAINSDCPLCHGSGWHVYAATVFDYGEETIVDMAKRCPQCSGTMRLKDRTGVPEEYHEADIYKFDFKAYSSDMTNLHKIAWSIFNQFDKWQDNGKGLYLWSKTAGSGKTFLACCLAKSIMLKYNLQMRFITAPDYISKVGDSYKKERGELDESQVYRDCALLVLDDIGAQVDKDWQKQEMFRLINHRMTNRLVTIFTSNMSVENLNVDERTKDRIIKTSMVLRMPEESIRRKKAVSEQDKFLEHVLGKGVAQ